MASRARYPVRLDCGHLVTFSGCWPKLAAAVYCVRCDGTRRVAFHYFDPRRPASGWCGAASPPAGRPRLRCTLEKGHDPADKHHDRHLGAWFTAGRELRSGASGAGGRPLLPDSYR